MASLAATTAAFGGEPPKAATAKPAPVRSVFAMPASARDGRDPFFPESTRPYEVAAVAKNSLDATAFSVKGLSIERGHALVIINNHTFAIGDEGDVTTASGRAHIRLAEIRTNVVVIEVNGSKRELSIGNK